MDWSGVATGTKQADRWKAFVELRQKDLGTFLQFDPALGSVDASPGGPLSGVPFAVKDNIAVRGFRLTCGSRMLRDFVSPYSATVIERLQKAGGVVPARRTSTSSGWGPPRRTLLSWKRGIPGTCAVSRAGRAAARPLLSPPARRHSAWEATRADPSASPRRSAGSMV